MAFCSESCGRIWDYCIGKYGECHERPEWDEGTRICNKFHYLSNTSIPCFPGISASVCAKNINFQLTILSFLTSSWHFWFIRLPPCLFLRRLPQGTNSSIGSYRIIGSSPLLARQLVPPVPAHGAGAVSRCPPMGFCSFGRHGNRTNRTMYDILWRNGKSYI